MVATIGRLEGTWTMEVAPEALVGRAEAAYNARDVDRVLALFTPDAVFQMNGKPGGQGDR